MLREGVINVYILQLSNKNKHWCVVNYTVNCYSVTYTVKCHSHYGASLISISIQF